MLATFKNKDDQKMNKCKLILKDEVNCKIIGLPVEVRRDLVKAFTYEKPGARYSPAYKLGRWDGKVSFFGIGGDGYIAHIPKMIDVLAKHNYEIHDLEDLRTPINLIFKKVTSDFWGDICWPDGHPMAGQPIRIRDDQVNSLNLFIENPQCIQELSTGYGKCVSYDTLIEIDVDETSEFGKYLLKKVIVHDPVMARIGDFIDIVSSFKNHSLIPNQELYCGDLDCQIKTPTGLATINYVIKKDKLPGLTFTFENEIPLTCANRHILLSNGSICFAESLRVGDSIDTKCGPISITDIRSSDITEYYDIAIDSPHLYYDQAGIIHHNTILTSTMVKLCEPYGRTVTIVPSTNLVQQTYEDFKNCHLDVGVYYGTKKETDKTHTICTWQSLSVLNKKSKDVERDDILTIKKLLNNVVAVIVDEAHILKATELKSLIIGNLSHVPIRWALTGTIPKDDLSAQSLYTSIGPVVNRVKAHELQEQGFLSSCHIHIKQLLDHRQFKNYHEEYKHLVTYRPRMAYIASMIKNISESGNTLILVDRIESGNILKEELDLLFNDVDRTPTPFITGAVKTNDRKDEYDEFQETNSKILIATSGVAAVGINIISLYNLVLIESGKSFVRVIQSIGRGLRKGFGKEHVDIWDITSNCKYSKKHLTERKSFYNDAKYPFKVEKIDWEN